jgi:hypothetical protein
MHENSTTCFKETISERSKRRGEILDAFKKADRPLSDREILQMIGRSDMNSVRPRITELVHEEMLIETGKIRDILTKKTVRVCELHRQLKF